MIVSKILDRAAAFITHPTMTPKFPRLIVGKDGEQCIYLALRKCEEHTVMAIYMGVEYPTTAGRESILILDDYEDYSGEVVVKNRP